MIRIRSGLVDKASVLTSIILLIIDLMLNDIRKSILGLFFGEYGRNEDA